MEDPTTATELNKELNIVYRFLVSKGIPHQDAEDAVQETAYKYLRYSDSIRSSKIRSWLIRVALNHYFDQCRRNKKYILNLEEINEPFHEEEPPDTVIANERTEELFQMISKLKPQYSELLLLKYHSNLSYLEISKLLNMSMSSIKTNLFRARKKLLNIYKEANDDE